MAQESKVLSPRFDTAMQEEFNLETSGLSGL